MTLPDHGLGSMTRAAEYVVAAARTSLRLSERRIAIVGHSQGGELAVWATRFWPDVAAGVHDVVALASPLGDPLGYALTTDALTHPGPADPRRIPRSTCQQSFIPHGDLAGASAGLASIVRFFPGITDPRRAVSSEPPLPAYAR